MLLTRSYYCMPLGTLVEVERKAFRCPAFQLGNQILLVSTRLYAWKGRPSAAPYRNRRVELVKKEGGPEQ